MSNPETVAEHADLVERIDREGTGEAFSLTARAGVTAEQRMAVIDHHRPALDFVAWLVEELRGMGMVVDVEMRQAANGLALLLTDATPRRQR